MILRCCCSSLCCSSCCYFASACFLLKLLDSCAFLCCFLRRYLRFLAKRYLNPINRCCCFAWMLHSINAFIGSHLLLKLLLLTVIVKCDSTKNQCNSYYYGHQSDHDFLLHNSRPFLILISILFAFISQSPCERHSPYNIFSSYNIRTFLSINSDGFQPVSDHIS